MRHTRRLLALLVLAFSGCGTILLRHPTASDLFRRQGFSWDSIAAGPRYTMFFETGLPPDATDSSFRADVNSSWAEVHAFLQLEPLSDTVAIFVVRSRERMRALTGLSVNATTFYRTGVICVVGGIRTLAAPVGHELVHLIAMRRWGVPERWLNEGLATAYSGRVLDQPLEQRALQLWERDSLPPLRRLIEAFGQHDTRISYVAAGSFLLHLRAAYGMTLVERIWRQGSDALPRAVGASWPEIEAAWIASLRTHDSDRGPP